MYIVGYKLPIQFITFIYYTFYVSPVEVFGHTKLSATRSAPYGAPIADIDNKAFTVPLAPGDGISPTAKARLARRRTSMQDSIDATNFNPEHYRALVREIIV